MNLSDSKKKLAIAGALCGLVAACLAYFGNPANMAFCIACCSMDASIHFPLAREDRWREN